MLAEIYQDVQRFKAGEPLEPIATDSPFPDSSYRHRALLVGTWEGLDGEYRNHGYSQRFVNIWAEGSQELLKLWRGKVRGYLDTTSESRVSLGNAIALDEETLWVYAYGDEREGNVTITRTHEEEKDHFNINLNQYTIGHGGRLISVSNGQLTMVLQRDNQLLGDKYNVTFKNDRIAVFEREIEVVDPRNQLPSWRCGEKRDLSSLCDQLARTSA